MRETPAPNSKTSGRAVQSNYREYDHIAGSSRISSILNAGDASYEETDNLPSRDRLTFTNGFYAMCTAVFIDIRGSSRLPSRHRRPTLSKLYRAFISEMVAVMNGNPDCVEVNIEGDGVWGVFSTPYKADINSAFATCFTLASVVDILNCWFRSKSISEISVGIGASYGRALMIKAGYSGSSINDVVYMGDVVNEASRLSSFGNKTWSDREIMVSTSVHGNVSEHNQGLLSWNQTRGCYHGNVIHPAINEWVAANCE